MAVGTKENGRSAVDPLSAAPTHDAKLYAQWLRARGALQADFDAKMGVVRSSHAFKDKAEEWRVGYDNRLSEMLPSR